MSRDKGTINHEYSVVCSEIGDLTARYEASKSILLARVAKLQEEMSNLDNKENHKTRGKSNDNV